MLNGAIGLGKTNTLMGEYSLRLGEAFLRNRTREAELTAKHESEIANRVKSEFVSNMSHELRTPLNTVMGFSKMLAEHDRRRIKDQDIVEYGQLILDAAGHLLALINDILDISKLQTGRFAIEARELSVEEVLEAAIASHRQAAELAGLKTDVRISPDLPMLHGDSVKLKQVFSNILTNSIKFTQADGSIFIEAVPTPEGGVRVMIRDTGVGMSEEEIDIALTPFGQVDGSRSRWREGAGLGLPIAKSLIELHGGQLAIQSAKLMGTLVEIILPPPMSVDTRQRQSRGRGATNL